ncbi:MAG: DUF1501 domain-containing protein [Saprospiraceae bacterium]|nr:DUF1501 domain-containing protein [Saprospiraceae bacterium]HRG33625.1 DUF1501 domain-containing protein [Saprospiraceae bacterium]
MKRRKFLQSVPITLGGITMSAYASNPLLSDITFSLLETDKVLVIIQLNGGNDGLNTVIPLDQYAVLSKSNIRQSILIPESKVLKLPGTNDMVGLHPSLGALHNLYLDNKLAIIQSVGYPQFSYSHFRAADIWISGANANELLNSGWAARYLSYEYPNYPIGFPNATMPDPLAIRLGGTITLGLQNLGVSMGISIYNTKDPLNLTGNLFSDPVTQDYMGKELAYAREVLRQTDKFGDAVQAAGDKGRNLSTKYPKSSELGYTLGTQLSMVAKLIDGGSKTRIFWLSTGGFDTHAAQVDATDHTIGVHANLLKGVSDAVGGFMDDLKLMGHEDRVLGMTFSEFGRRIIATSSAGTDHGAAQPLFVFGGKVNGGVFGNNPIIDPASNVNSNLPMQYDFRSVYASILEDWFCVPTSDIDKILFKNYQKLSFINPNNCLNTATHDKNNSLGKNMIYAYPNPFVESTKIKFETFGGFVMIEILNNQGTQIKTVLNIILPPGKYDVDCNLEDAPEGIYYIRIQNEQLQQVKPVMKIR